MKPHAPACDRNRDPILDVLRQLVPVSAGPTRVLEIGSGTGQHAVYFGSKLPHVEWQTSDVAERLPGVRLWLNEAGLGNLPPPVELDVDRFGPLPSFDLVFSANTAHIMSASSVANMVRGAATVLPDGGQLVLYGPFTRDGLHTSESNRRFDADLRARNGESGLRDLVAMDEWAAEAGFSPHRLVDMPANNFIVVWRKG